MSDVTKFDGGFGGTSGMKLEIKQRKPPLKKKRLPEEVEIVTKLALMFELHDAPVKTERHGKWYEVVIPIGKDHCAYLTMPEDTLEQIKFMWDSNWPYE
jgi:hypothetical protein